MFAEILSPAICRTYSDPTILPTEFVFRVLITLYFSGFSDEYSNKNRTNPLVNFLLFISLLFELPILLYLFISLAVLTLVKPPKTSNIFSQDLDFGKTC